MGSKGKSRKNFRKMRYVSFTFMAVGVKTRLCDRPPPHHRPQWLGAEFFSEPRSFFSEPRSFFSEPRSFFPSRGVFFRAAEVFFPSRGSFSPSLPVLLTAAGRVQHQAPATGRACGSRNTSTTCCSWLRVRPPCNISTRPSALMSSRVGMLFTRKACAKSCSLSTSTL